MGAPRGVVVQTHEGAGWHSHCQISLPGLQTQQGVAGIWSWEGQNGGASRRGEQAEEVARSNKQLANVVIA